MRPLTRRDLLRGAAAVGALGVAAACSKGSTAPAPARSGPSAGAGGSQPTPAPGGPATFVAHGPRDRRELALTFHGSGDTGLAERLLAVAESRHVPVTVFAVGSWLDAHPEQAQRILRGGHELANHTYTHPSLDQLPAAAVLKEITGCRDVLARLAGGPARWFRPSAMDVPTPLVSDQSGKAGYATVVGFDVDPHDYQDPGASLVRSRTLAGAQPGSVVSLHLGHSGTVNALGDIIDGLTGKGLRPVTVSELLRH